MTGKPLTQQMIDTPIDNDTEKRGLYATASKHLLVTGGLALAGAGLAYAVGRLVMASHREKIARDVNLETSDDQAMKKTSTDQPNDRWFEKARTGAMAVTGNAEQGPPQRQSSPRDNRDKPASEIAGEKAGKQAGSRRPEATTRAA
jgi:hypothetical protein